MEHVQDQTILMNETFLKRNEGKVDIEDRGYQFGDGIYEVLRVYHGHIFLMDAHLARLERSATEIQLVLPSSLKKLEDNLKKLVALNKCQEAIIYIQITRGVSPRSHVFPALDTPPQLTAYTKDIQRPVEAQKKGVKAMLMEDIRWLRCDIKSLNLLGSVLAKEKAAKVGAHEAIQHRNHIVTEGSATNVCIVQDGILYTHPATNLILNGITRLHVLRLCQEQGITYKEESFTTEQLLQADEAFTTGTTSEIVPIIQVDDAQIGVGIVGPLTRKLQETFNDSIEAECQS